MLNIIHPIIDSMFYSFHACTLLTYYLLNTYPEWILGVIIFFIIYFYTTIYNEAAKYQTTQISYILTTENLRQSWQRMILIVNNEQRPLKKFISQNLGQRDGGVLFYVTNASGEEELWILSVGTENDCLRLMQKDRDDEGYWISIGKLILGKQDTN